jgi:hypothetical protein
MGETMNILIMVLATFASIGCLALVVTDILYEEPVDAPDYAHNAIGIMISVGSLAVPALVANLILNLF